MQLEVAERWRGCAQRRMLGDVIQRARGTWPSDRPATAHTVPKPAVPAGRGRGTMEESMRNYIPLKDRVATAVSIDRWGRGRGLGQGYQVESASEQRILLRARVLPGQEPERAARGRARAVIRAVSDFLEPRWVVLHVERGPFGAQDAERFE